MAACRATLGERHADTLTSINSLGYLLAGQGRLDVAALILTLTHVYLQLNRDLS